MANTHHTVDTGTHIAKLQSDVAAMKQTLSAMSEVQDEILSWVKKLKKGFEADQLDIGKCCHTVRITLAHFLIIIQLFYTSYRCIKF